MNNLFATVIHFLFIGFVPIVYQLGHDLIIVLSHREMLYLSDGGDVFFFRLLIDTIFLFLFYVDGGQKDTCLIIHTLHCFSHFSQTVIKFLQKGLGFRSQL